MEGHFRSKKVNKLALDITMLQNLQVLWYATIVNPNRVPVISAAGRVIRTVCSVAGYGEEPANRRLKVRSWHRKRNYGTTAYIDSRE